MHRYRWLLLLVGWLLAILAPVALTLLLMPVVPSMQTWDSVGWSFSIHRFAWPITIVGAAMVIYGILLAWPTGRWYSRVFMVLLPLVAIAIHVMVSQNMTAEGVFNEPSVVHRTLIDEGSAAASDTTIYVWVSFNGQLAGYPLDLVAHHHKIQDTVGGIPVLVTYCTMCHTGRVYSPILGGKREEFRLVGANHFNAMFEDATTKSWWYQATGVCVQGERIGMKLLEFPFVQGTLAEARALYPNTVASVFDRDTATGGRYDWSAGYAHKHGDTTADLEKRSLVIGVEWRGSARAYPLRALLRAHTENGMLRDTIGTTPVYITVPRSYEGNVVIRTDTTATATRIQPLQEYWHSWKHFHPATTVWKQ